MAYGRGRSSGRPRGRAVALEHDPVETRRPTFRRTLITRTRLDRRQLLAIAAGFALLLLLAQAMRGPDEASAQGSQNKKDDLGSLVASGNAVEGQTKPSGKTQDRTLPQTGTEIHEPLIVGLVLLLDGALALLLSNHRPRALSPH